MNEQIEHCLYQAGLTAQGCWDELDDYAKQGIEKFAELIVLECMRMCEVAEMGFETHGCSVEASGAITVKEYIAEHFGVEE